MNVFRQHPTLEFLPLEKQREVQALRLSRHVALCARRSPYYRTLFKQNGIDAASLTMDTLTGLPPTDKTAFAEHNDEFLAVQPSKVVDIVLSSGTTGKPTRVMYTERDLQRLAHNEELSFASCGLTAADIALLTCTMDRCFIAGLAYFLGIRALGAAAIRNGHGTLTGHTDIIASLRPTVIVGVPSFLRKLGRHLAEHGMDPASSSVRKLVCIGEPVRDRHMNLLPLGRDLETIWKASVHSTYASSECITSFCECTACRGGHLHPDLAIVEILDDDNRPLPPGRVGEIVLTPLAIQGMPLIRFKTGDVGFLLTEPCACGRLSPRLGPILGRKQQMMKVRGTSLYPQAVFAVLDDIPGLGEYYLDVQSHDNLSDELTLHLGDRPGRPSVEHVQERLQAGLRVRLAIVVDPEERLRQHVFSPESRKPVRFVDRRQRP